MKDDVLARLVTLPNVLTATTSVVSEMMADKCNKIDR
jgi:hypothetical protein